ncbi:hypothetical protein CHLRE_13g577600v5 [Chlamydomonas reinhardtii]|nr:uncharacterized protein CHLRE_13g577600v5 [Chlamydomonas reinhardtii]PNW73906.1 hypothetical protein CHLRE_13g577600v5 [Chlamydomonas reinhardtii]
MQVRAAAWASLSARWAGAASASWRAWLMAVIRAVQFAVRASLWLLVWIPVSTCTGMVSRLDEYWPLSVSVCVFVVQVCRAVSGGALPPADVSANLLWLVGDIRSLAGIALFSWKSLLVAQERGAWILVNWCKEWMGCATVVA